MVTVTLTTDYGQKGYYLAALKGAILSGSPDVQFVDVSHLVMPYDIVQGAFILSNTFHHFPQGTIHVACINNVSSPLELIAFQHEGHFFIGPDNGIFSLMLDEPPASIYRLWQPCSLVWPSQLHCSGGTSRRRSHYSQYRVLVDHIVSRLLRRMAGPLPSSVIRPVAHMSGCLISQTRHHAS